MSFETDRAVRGELALDEHLLWSGMPRQGVRVRARDVPGVLFMLVWLAVVVYWEGGVMAADAPVAILLVGAAFFAYGLYFVFGRFIVDRIRRSRTYYAVTDQRVLIASGLRRRQVKSLALGGLADVSLSEGSGGRGSITFGAATLLSAQPGSTARPGFRRRSATAFDSIEDVRRVYHLIREARRSAATGLREA